MAIAEYHERAALAASQVIAGFDAELFRNALEQTVVGLAVDRQSASSTEGRILAELTVRLLARLYPSLEIRVELPDEAERLSGLARAVNPRIEITTGASTGISIGLHASTFPTTYFAGCHAWDAWVSCHEPLATGPSQNPLGASAAACIAAANMFQRILVRDWEQRITQQLIFSTFHGSTERTAAEIPNDGWDLSEQAVLVGAGAIGNGALWALGNCPLTGALHIVDPETLELSNLQRYILCSRSDEGRAKVDVVEPYFRRSLTLIRHKATWDTFVSEAGYNWPHVLVALDSAAGRRTVQASLPKWIANSWTQPGDLGASVHGRFDGPSACLSCLYLPTERQPNEDELVAHALGIPELATEVRTLLYTGAGVPRRLIETIAGALQLPLADVLPYEGRPVRHLYVEGVCGGGLISLGSAGTPRQELHVPLAHQSALAGVLLAAALIKHSLSFDDERTMITRINLLNAIAGHLTQPALKAGNGLCICEDADYVSVFQRKYGCTK